MRFIKINDVTENMVLASPLYDSKGTILLNTNVVLTNKMIRSLKERQYKGIYILDKLTDDIIANDNVSIMTRIESLQITNSHNLDDFIYVSNKIVEDLQFVDGIYTNLNLLSDFDTATYMHSLNVAIYAGTLGMISGLAKERVKLLVEAAILHDIGKRMIPLSILNKPGKLTDEEREIINLHPRYGYDFLKEFESIPSAVRVSVLEHHENEDGSGYPNGYDSSHIYVFAKIIHICDVYEAMLAKRTYKNRINPTYVIEYMQSQSGTMFDKDLLALFLQNIIPYPEGMSVKLSNGESAVIKKNHREFPTRPIVLLNDGQVINLLEHNELIIEDYDD